MCKLCAVLNARLRAPTASTAAGPSNSSLNYLIHQQMAHNLEGGTYRPICVMRFLISVLTIMQLIAR